MAAAGERDLIPSLLADYAATVSYESLSSDTVRVAKRRIVDTIGCIFPGLDGEPSRLARRLAAETYRADVATILGMSDRTTIDMAAFVNATTARYAELNDSNHISGKLAAHPSDVITPLIAITEHSNSSGRDLIAAVVLGYEILRRMVEATHLEKWWDATNWVTLGTAVGSASLLGLDREATMEAISMAVVPNNALRRSRLGAPTMWKALASGQAARAGTFAALLAGAGLRGPSLPYSGEAGWAGHVARDIDIDILRDLDPPTRIHQSIIKPRGCCGIALASGLAAEKAFDQELGVGSVDRVLVETFDQAKILVATDPALWRPQTKEAADHSIPFVVAVGLTDGFIGPDQFDQAHISDPDIQRLVNVVEVVEKPEYTIAYNEPPHLHCARVTVYRSDGTVQVGESGGIHGELGTEWDDPSIEEKFTRLTDGHLEPSVRREVLDRMWALEDQSIPDLLPLLASSRALAPARSS